jgi:hypothetical protein
VPVLKNYLEGKEFDLSVIRPKDFNHFVRHHDEEETTEEPQDFSEPAVL